MTSRFSFLLGLAASMTLSASGLVSGLAQAQEANDLPSAQAWTTFKGNNQRTGLSSARVTLPLALQWRFSSLAPARSYDASPLVLGAPGSQTVYFGAGRNIYALDSQTGAQTWRTPELPSDIAAPLTLLSSDRGDLILVPLSSGRLRAVRSSDGGLVWEADSGARFSSAGPLVAQTPNGTRIFAALSTGRLIAFDEGGKRVPNFEAVLDRFGVLPASNLALSSDGNTVLAVTSDGQLHGVDVATGRLLFEERLGSNTATTPVVAGNRAIVGAARVVTAFDATGGRRLWRFAARGDVTGSPALWRSDESAPMLAIFGTRNGWMQALDVQTGALRWEKEVGISITGSVTALPDMAVVGTGNGLLLGVDPQNGDLKWQYRLGAEREVAPRRSRSEGGDGNFVPEGGGFDGGAATTTPTETRTYGVSSAPAAVEGRVYVLGDDAALYAFTSEPFDADTPRVIEPTIAVPGSDTQILPLLITPQNPRLVPGGGPFYFAALLDDVGSGIDPQSLQITLDNNPVDPSRVFFERSTGVLTVTLVDPQKNDSPLRDGLKTISIAGRDYAGNALSFTTNFSVDNTAPRPEPPRPAFDPNLGGEGGAGFGGEGFNPGGGRGGFRGDF